MSDAIVFPVARLESDEYSVPRGTHGIGKPLEKMKGYYEVYWLPPETGSSLPVADEHMVPAPDLVIPVELLPPEYRRSS